MFVPADGQRLAVSRADGGRYVVAGPAGHLVHDPQASLAGTCTDGRRHARQGIRCKHVWARILTALGYTLPAPGGVLDRSTRWGEPVPAITVPANTEEVAMSNGTNDGGWQGRQYRHSGDALGYPFVQFVNSGGDLDPRQQQGGFAAPVDQGVPIPGVTATLHHKGGGSTPVIYAPELTLAVVKTRFAWVKQGRRISGYEPGARGKLQVLAIIQTTAGPQVAMLTFTGIAGRNFGAVRKAHADSVRKATSGQAPAWAFWLTTQADGTELAGKDGAQSPVTKLALAREVDADQDYVGPAVADQIEALLDGPAVQWAAAWGSDEDGDDGAGDEPARQPAPATKPA
ncbi:MAG: hypothetical protein KKA73_03985, partial [Chloroflexi bacterium]|nr:hypothetical protein [Chloroflexota bacterium]